MKDQATKVWPNLMRFLIGFGVACSPLLTAVAVGQQEGTKLYPSDDAACGVSCLYIAARVLDKEVDLSKLADACNLTVDGCSLLDLKRAAEALGFKTTGYFSRDRNWRHLDPLMIAHVDENHFVLVLNVSKAVVTFADPARAPDLERLPAEMFARRWSGHALKIERAGPGTLPSATQRVSIREDYRDTKTTIDLGPMLSDGQFSAVVELRNDAHASITIKDVIATCGCTIVEPRRNVLRPGESAALPVSVNTHGLEGNFNKSVIVQIQAPERVQTVAVLLTGTIQHDGRLLASPPELRLYRPVDKTEAPALIVLRRRGGEALNFVKATALFGNVRAEIPHERIRSAMGDRIEIAVLAPQKLSGGMHRGKLIVQTAHPVHRTLEVPLQARIEHDVVVEPNAIVIDGTLENGGAPVAEVRLRCNADKSVHIAGASLEPTDLGTALVGPPDSRSVQVRVSSANRPRVFENGTLHLRLSDSRDVVIPVHIRNALPRADFDTSVAAEQVER